MRSMTFQHYFLIASLLLAVQLSSCLPLPIPHKVVEVPVMDGTLVDQVSGSPLSGAAVERGAAREEKAVTDANGVFQIRGQKEWKYWVFIPLAEFVSVFQEHQTPFFIRTDRCGEISDTVCWTNNLEDIPLGTIAVNHDCSLTLLRRDGEFDTSSLPPGGTFILPYCLCGATKGCYVTTK
jgi:hypothetical protein